MADKLQSLVCSPPSHMFGSLPASWAERILRRARRDGDDTMPMISFWGCLTLRASRILLMHGLSMAKASARLHCHVDLTPGSPQDTHHHTPNLTLCGISPVVMDHLRRSLPLASGLPVNNLKTRQMRCTPCLPGMHRPPTLTATSPREGCP